MAEQAGTIPCRYPYLSEEATKMEQGSNTKMAILGAVILLAIIGGFFGWRASQNGLTPQEAAKLTTPVTLPAGGAPNLRPPASPTSAPTLPSQMGGTSLIPPPQQQR
jgi:hypothetical protein